MTMLEYESDELMAIINVVSAARASRGNCQIFLEACNCALKRDDVTGHDMTQLVELRDNTVAVINAIDNLLEATKINGE